MPPAPESWASAKLTTSVAAGAVLLSSLCWALLFCLCYLVSRNRKLLFSCLVRVIPLLHGLIVVALTFIAIREQPYPILDSGEKNTPFHNLILVISLGYFIFDSLYLLISKSEPTIMIAHHFCGVIALVGALFIQEGGAEMMIGMFFTESTNPLFQFRAILRLTKYKDGPFYKIVEWTFVILFTLTRVFCCGILTLLIVFDPASNLHIFLTFIVFYIFSLVLVYYTWAYVIKKYFKKPKRS